MTLAPVSAVPTMARKPEKSSRPVPAHSTSWGARPVVARCSSSVSETLHLQHPGVGVDRDDVTVADPGERTAEGGLGGEVDRGGDLAGGAGHPAVGDDRNPLATVLQHAERGHQLVELGHAVGCRPLVAHDGDEVAVVETTLGEGGQEARPGRRRPWRAPSRRGARA